MIDIILFGFIFSFLKSISFLWIQISHRVEIKSTTSLELSSCFFFLKRFKKFLSQSIRFHLWCWLFLMPIEANHICLEMLQSRNRCDWVSGSIQQKWWIFSIESVSTLGKCLISRWTSRNYLLWERIDNWVGGANSLTLPNIDHCLLVAIQNCLLVTRKGCV